MGFKTVFAPSSPDPCSPFPFFSCRYFLFDGTERIFFSFLEFLTFKYTQKINTTLRKGSKNMTNYPLLWIRGGQSGGASCWRVCYQGGLPGRLPRLVLKCLPKLSNPLLTEGVLIETVYYYRLHVVFSCADCVEWGIVYT